MGIAAHAQVHFGDYYRGTLDGVSDSITTEYFESDSGASGFLCMIYRDESQSVWVSGKYRKKKFRIEHVSFYDGGTASWRGITEGKRSIVVSLIDPAGRERVARGTRIANRFAIQRALPDSG